MNIIEILVVIFKHMDDVSIYCFYQTSKSNIKILFELIQTKIINVSKKNLIYQNLCRIVVENDQLELLEWARKTNHPWSNSTSIIAAKNGHLKILKWALKNNCPLNESTCKIAAQRGHLKVLKWLRSKNCPWDENTFPV